MDSPGRCTHLVQLQDSNSGQCSIQPEDRLWYRSLLFILSRSLYMSLTPEDILKIAHLARLEVPEDKSSDYARELSAILDFVEQMNEADTDDILPLSHPQDATLRMREDRVTESDQRERYQHLAPETEGGHYLVPKVIE